MLDQNTDRKYWMIGTIMVVGAMIGILSIAFPEITTLLVDSFKAKITAGI